MRVPCRSPRPCARWLRPLTLQACSQILEDTIGPEFRHKIDGVRTCNASSLVGRVLSIPQQIYKLADEFTFSGSEETFSKLQAELEVLEVRRLLQLSPSLLSLTHTCPA